MTVPIEWNANRKRAAFPRRTHNFNGAAMGFGDVSDQCQTKASTGYRTIFWRRYSIKCFEYTFPLLGSDSDSMVHNLNYSAGVFGAKLQGDDTAVS